MSDAEMGDAELYEGNIFLDVFLHNYQLFCVKLFMYGLKVSSVTDIWG